MASGGGQRVAPPLDASGKISKKSNKRGSPTSPRQPRKRTKTGCLTCRKRRIKCGEERPTCMNCHKSRRECEGYRPPIVFRRSHLHSGQPGVSLAPHASLNDPYFNSLASQFGSIGQEGLPGWSSVPSEWNTSSAPERSSGFSHAVPQGAQQAVPSVNAHMGFHAFTSAEFEQTPAQFFEPDIWQLPVSGDMSKPTFAPHSRSSHEHTPGITPISQDETLSLFHETVSDPSLYGHEPYRPVNQNDNDFPQTSSTDYHPASIEATSDQTVPPTFTGHYPVNGLGAHGTVDPVFSGSDSNRSIQHLDGLYSFAQREPGLHTSVFGLSDASQFLDTAAISTQDDDYWDVQSVDEDSETEDNTPFDPVALDREFDTITTLTKSAMALAISNLTDANAYTYPGFSLDSYRPERTANPLRNPYTQRVFAHFVFSTGPLISFLQQRNRVALSSTLTPGSVKGSFQGLWTYTLATMALHNQALLHAMLAMASLHMAKLQGASITPSLKHYSYSLRRVHRDVQHDRKRHEVPTLAATLLLAFYEIMQADHRKWSTHLVGAKQLISEIDFAGMTAQVEYQKARAAAETLDGDTGSRGRPSSTGAQEEYPIGELFPDCDPLLIAKLMGKKCDRDKQGRLVKDWTTVDTKKDLDASDLRSFQVLQDLFWWNCRHDIIHGLVGGNPLLLNYEKWKDCQPRAPAGRPDAVHGSFDHFILLMGRLVAFITQDRPRKIRAAKAVSVSAQQAAGGHNDSASGPPPPTGPGFYGMAPSSGPGPLPRAFQKLDGAHSSPEPSEPSSPPASAAVELEAATAMALQEWNDIISAFTAFADSLGPSFQPLTDDEHSPFTTPFGAAVLFKSHGIAALWAWYYAGLAIAMRSHPTMPAPATMAIGYAAKDTAKYANQVGRIVYCISSDFLTPPLDPSSAGAFSESSLPLFFAGVQFQDPEQRKWTIGRLREVEALTGWATIGLCANGCESAWIKAHEMGRGPKYVRSTGIEMGEGSIWVSEEAQEEDGPLAGTGASSTRGSSISKQNKTQGTSSANEGGASKDNSRHPDGGARATEAERRFSPFYRGTQVMWAYQLFNTSLEDDIAGMPIMPPGQVNLV